MRKIPVKYAPLTFALLMSCAMVIIMSGFITAMNTGIDHTFAKRWFISFLSAWPVAFVCVLLFAGRVRKIVGHICAPL
jgi:hypothetical protein